MKLLLVEDDDLDARVAQRAFSGQQDFHIERRALSLAEATALLQETTYDAVLLDLGLPDAKGIDSVSVIRKLAPDMVIIVLTGDDDESKAMRALSLGAQDYLAKGETSAATLSRALRYARERMSIEKQLRQKTDELQEAVTQLENTREQQLQFERLQITAALAHGVAHKFNNNLSVILGNAELLESGLKSLSDIASRNARELLASINEAAVDAGRVSAALGSAFDEQRRQGLVPKLPLGTDLASVINSLGGEGKALGEILTDSASLSNAASGATALPEQTDGSPAVLLVDDEDGVRSILVRMLTNRGLLCDSFADPEEALAAFDPSHHVVALIDRAMPGMSGDELAKRLKARAPDLSIVMLTGYGSMMKQEGDWPAMVDAILSKPCSADDLVATLEDVCPAMVPGQSLAPASERAKDAAPESVQEPAVAQQPESAVSIEMPSVGESFYALTLPIAMVDANGVVRVGNKAWNELGIASPGQSYFSRMESKASPLLPPMDNIEQFIHDAKAVFMGEMREAHLRCEMPLPADGDGTADKLPVEVAVFPMAESGQVFGGLVAHVVRRRQALLLGGYRDLSIWVLTWLQDMPEGIVFFGRDTFIDYINPAGVRMFGFNSDEIIGQRGEDVWTQDPDFWTIYHATRRSGEKRRIERFVENDGIWLAVAIYPSSYGAAVFFRNITNERRQEAASAAEERIESIGVLASGMAHDFNNLLSVILSLADELLGSDMNYESSTRGLTQIREAATTGAAIVGRLLRFARRSPIEAEEADFEQILRSLRDGVSRTVGTSVDVAIEVDEPLWKILLDRHEFAVALLNLCSNARDAIDGAGKVTLRADNFSVGFQSETPSFVEPGDYVRLRVTDTGQGIAVADLQRVVQPYFTTKAEGEGTGLGLSGALGFMKQSGGYLYIESEVGIGTAVTLLFPKYLESDEMAVDGGSQVVRVSLQGLSVVVVDDEPLVRQLLRRQLESQGCEPRLCATPVEALDALRQLSGRIVLVTDLFLGEGASGVDLALAARAEKHDLAVVISTGDQVAADALVSLDRIPPALLKPAKTNALAQSIQQALAMAEAPIAREPDK